VKKASVLLAVLFAKILFSQIVVINTGTSDNLLGISKSGNNILVSGSKSFLAKCYGDCNSVQTLAVPPFPNSNYRFMVNRPDTDILYMTVSSFQDLNLSFWKSIDGGFSWVRKFDTVSGAMYSGATGFFNKQNGLTICPNQSSILTNNGFSSYSFGSWPDTYVYGAEVNGDSTMIIGFLGAAVAGMRLTNDQGKTWTGIGPKYGLGVNPPIDFEFLNNDTILSVTGVVNGTAHFMVTFDKGATPWTDYTFTGSTNGAAPPETFTRICAKNAKEIYVLGRTGLSGSDYTGNAVILKTLDLGKSWYKYEIPFQKYLWDMKFLNDSIALVCGDDGLLFKWSYTTAIFTRIAENDRNKVNLNFYPNPVHDKLHIEFEKGETKVKITISDILGRTVFTSTTALNKNEIDFTNFSPGVYFVRSANAKTQRVLKVIKE
jgi:hypothetical protein